MWTVLFLCSAWLGAEPPPSPALQLARQVQAAYRQGGDMTANFVQIQHDVVRQRPRQESGRLWAKPDGRVRWVYESAEPKVFVFDGHRAFFFEPNEAQVTVFDNFGATPLAGALQFLWGAGAALGEFEVALATAAEDLPALQPGEAALRLQPKCAMAAVDHLYLVVQRGARRVRSARLVDPLGNRTDYLFSKVAFVPRLDDARFAFEVPPGVAVLRAAS